MVQADVELMSPGRAALETEETGGGTPPSIDTDLPEYWGEDEDNDPAEMEIQSLLPSSRAAALHSHRSNKEHSSPRECTPSPFAPALSPRTRSGPARLFQRSASPHHGRNIHQVHKHPPPPAAGTPTLPPSRGSTPSFKSMQIAGTPGPVPTVVRRRQHGRGFVITFVIFAAATMVLLGVISILHISLLRQSANSRLGNVLAIIESAEYYPIRNGLHSEQPDLKRRYSRMLSSRQGVQEEEEVRRVGEEATVVMDGHGEASVLEQEKDEEDERQLAAVRLERETLLSSHHQKEHPKGPPAKLCSVTYSMNLTDHDAKQIDLDPYDQELLGTIMVRLCNCQCAMDDGVEEGAGGGGGKKKASRPPTPGVDSLTLMSEILRGAHVVVDGDKGAFYSWFTQMQDSYRRTSSHRSIVPMYGIDEGSVLRTVLTGRDVDGHTWLQFEGAGWDPFRRPLESIIHAVNYVQYKLTGRQVGPLGVSEFTDARPIHLSFDGCLDERALLFNQFHPDDPVGKGPKPSIASSAGGRLVSGMVGGGRRVLQALTVEEEEGEKSHHLRSRSRE